MHYVAICFHSADIDDLMRQYHTDNEEMMVFYPEKTERQLRAEFRRHVKAGNEYNYKSFEHYVRNHWGYQKEGDKYGFYSNPNGLYDWYTVGGRWKGMLFPKGVNIAEFEEAKKKELKELHKKVMAGQNKVMTEYHEIDLREQYLKLQKMTVYQYMSNGKGVNELMAGAIDWKLVKKVSMSFVEYRELNNITLSDLFHNVIDEDDGVLDNGDFTEKDILDYDKKWTERGGIVTVVDYHS